MDLQLDFRDSQCKMQLGKLGSFIFVHAVNK